MVRSNGYYIYSYISLLYWYSPYFVSNLNAYVCSFYILKIMFSIAKGKRINATQEMLALGFCNIAGSFVQAFPATGSFSRTAINNTSGVRTPLGGLFTGGIVLAALAFLSPYFYFIPKVRHHVFYASHLYMHIATSYISVGCCG